MPRRMAASSSTTNTLTGCVSIVYPPFNNWQSEPECGCCGGIVIPAQIQMTPVGTDNLASDIQAQAGARRSFFRCNAPIETFEHAFTFFLAYRTTVVRNHYFREFFMPVQFDLDLTTRL